MSGGGMSGGAMSRGGGGAGGGMSGGSGMSHAPSFSQPRAQGGAAGAGGRNASGNDAAAGAAYANRNQYDQYHPGMATGYWNGHYGNAGVASYGGMAMAGADAAVASAYNNPYAAAGAAAVDAGQPADAAQPVDPAANNAPAANAAAVDYSQPLDPAAAPPDAQPPADPANSPVAQARNAFSNGDYANALQLTQQALGQMPNDVSLHEFLALVLFAQGSYEDAAAPLYAVISVGPGWNWTTLIGNYSDASVYTEQFRGLEAFVKANPKSAKALFVLAYHYISQGHGDTAIKILQDVVSLQPDDQVSAALLAALQSASAPPPAPTPAN
jgi:tetratricopeptide (TPR) repeat protein